MKSDRIAKIKKYNMSFSSSRNGHIYYLEELNEILNGKQYWASPKGFFTNITDLEAYRQNETKITRYRVCIWHEEHREIKPELVYKIGV